MFFEFRAIGTLTKGFPDGVNCGVVEFKERSKALTQLSNPVELNVNSALNETKRNGVDTTMSSPVVSLNAANEIVSKVGPLPPDVPVTTCGEDHGLRIETKVSGPKTAPRRERTESAKFAREKTGRVLEKIWIGGETDSKSTAKIRPLSVPNAKNLPEGSRVIEVTLSFEEMLRE
jgi:hypothetical protein